MASDQIAHIHGSRTSSQARKRKCTSFCHRRYISAKCTPDEVICAKKHQHYKKTMCTKSCELSGQQYIERVWSTSSLRASSISKGFHNSFAHVSFCTLNTLYQTSCLLFSSSVQSPRRISCELKSSVQTLHGYWPTKSPFQSFPSRPSSRQASHTRGSLRCWWFSTKISPGRLTYRTGHIYKLVLKVWNIYKIVLQDFAVK